jgi:hypothetical protein
MPARSKVVQLPAEVRAELDARLIAGGFSGYEALAEWLSMAGYSLSKSALHRYGSDLEADFERTMADVQRTQQMAQAYAEANPDERNALTGATVRIAQESLLRITLSLRQMQDDPAQVARLMPNVTRALVDLGRLDISREKWAQERLRVALSEAADSAASVGRGQGISQDGIAALRAAIMGEL